MNEKVTKAVTVVKEFWTRQDKKKKIGLIAGLAAVIVIAIIIAAVLNHKDYVVLYEGLTAEESSEMVSIIQEQGYECSLASNGTITVPSGTENSIIMALALQGYPKSSVNYDIYTENVGMFTTESEKKEYERIAAENRMSAILSMFEGVDSAVVTINVPEKKNTVIESVMTEPTAFAVLYLEKGEKLENEQIEGIFNVMKHGYSGLTDDNITLVDGTGVLLVAEDPGTDVIAEETRRLKFKTDLESQIRQKIENLLTSAYGEGGFSAEVNMVLNFDSKVYEDTVYTPSTNDERGMLQHADAENATGYTTVDGGIVGVETNADDTYPTGDTSDAGQWSESSVSNTYLVNTYKEQVEKAGYVIDGLSISVVIFTDYLPEATRQELVRLVANAATVNPELASDVVTVTNLAKYEDITAVSAERTYFGLTLGQLIILSAILLGILLILIIILAIVSGKTKQRRKSFEKRILEQHTGADGEPLVENFLSLGGVSDVQMDIPSLVAEEAAETKDVIIKREISEFANHSPEIVAQLLRSWMKDDGANMTVRKSGGNANG